MNERHFLCTILCAIWCIGVRADRARQYGCALALKITALPIFIAKRTHCKTATMALQAIAHKVMGPLSAFYKRQVAYELSRYGALLRSMQK
jgi:hypothetical protein